MEDYKKLYEQTQSKIKWITIDILQFVQYILNGLPNIFLKLD